MTKGTRRKKDAALRATWIGSELGRPFGDEHASVRAAIRKLWRIGVGFGKEGPLRVAGWNTYGETPCRMTRNQ